MEKAVAITRHCVASRLLRNDLLMGLLANGDRKHCSKCQSFPSGRLYAQSKNNFKTEDAGETGSHTEKAMSLHGDKGTIIVTPID